MAAALGSVSSACSSVRSAAFGHRRCLGVRRAGATFEFHPGRVFAHVRWPMNQSRAAAYAERIAGSDGGHQVTVDGITHMLPDPFFVSPRKIRRPCRHLRCPIRNSIAPVAPSPSVIRRGRGAGVASAGAIRRDLIAQSLPVLGADDVLKLCVRRSNRSACQRSLDRLRAGACSRAAVGMQACASGCRPRAGMPLAARPRAPTLVARAAITVMPEDVQALFAAVAAHRLVPDARRRQQPTLAKASCTRWRAIERSG